MGLNEDYDALRKLVEEMNTLSSKKLLDRRKSALLKKYQGHFDSDSGKAWQEYVTQIDHQLKLIQSKWSLYISLGAVTIAVSALIKSFFG